MNPPRIVVTRKLPDAVEDRLRDRFTVAFNSEDLPFSRERMEAAFDQADGVLTTVNDPVDRAILTRSSRTVQIVSNFGVGVNNIDLEAARDAGVVVSNTPGVLTDATADLAIALMLAATRRFHETETALRRGEWDGFRATQWLGMGLQGKTIGIVGMGRIGQATARRAHLAFGMDVIYYNRSPVDGLDFPASRRTTMEAVFEEADVVSLHIPGGGENRGIVSAGRIGLMKPTAYLVNTARGDIVDEPALVAALRERRIAGAGLDVYAEEPKVPADLSALDNVTLLPHIGSATLETRTAMGMLAVDNLEAHFEGRPLPARVR
jgi:lactate dehydrogenase-like 2-hydroxyacid dehydrogenase